MNPNDAYIYEDAARQRESARKAEEDWQRMRLMDLPPLDPSASEYPARSVYEWISRRNQ